MAFKKVIVPIVISALLLGLSAVSQAASVFDAGKVKQVIMNVYHNGTSVSLKDPANSGNYLFMIYNNRTYVPIRFVAETMGADSSTMWNSNTPQNIYLNANSPAEPAEASSAAAIRISDLEKANASLQDQINQLNMANYSMNQQVAAERQKAADTERRYQVLVNTDNVSFPYFRKNVPSQFITDDASFLNYLGWNEAAARVQLLKSDLVTNMLKKYCEGTSVTFRQTSGCVEITGVQNANVLKDVAEIQQVVNQLGFSISFDYTPFGYQLYQPKL